MVRSLETTNLMERSLETTNSKSSTAKITVLSFFAIAVCYADRVLISVAIIPMADAFGWSLSLQGVILSSFYAGYLLTQVYGGWLADKIGGHKVLFYAVLVWSAFTALTPISAGTALWILIAVRIGMGLGEAPSIPAIYSIYGRHLPAGVRSRAITFTVSAIPFGTIATLLLSPVIISAYGWEISFYLFASLGLVWAFFWRFLRWGNEDKTVDTEQPPSEKPANQPTIRDFLKHKAVWAIIVTHFCAHWSTYVFLAWMPKYVSEVLDVDFRAIGIFAMLPQILSFLFLNLSGWLADYLLSRGMERTKLRKILTVLGLGGAAVFLLSFSLVDNPYIAIAISSLGVGIASLSMSGFAVSHLDIAPNNAGTLFGLSSTAGALPGVIGVSITGAILEYTGSWSLVFGLAGLVALIGATVYTLFGSAERQF